MSKSLLLISERPEDQDFASAVASTAGLTLSTARNAVLGVDVLASESPPVVFVDGSEERYYQSFENTVQEKLGLFSDRVSSSTIHFISSREIEDASYLIQSPLFANYISRSWGADPTSAGTQYGRVVGALISKRAFGLAQLMDPSAKIQLVRLSNSNQKQEAVEAVRSYLVSARFQNRMAATISNAVDELLMNAIFDAPIDDVGRQLYKLTARHSQIKLEGKHLVEMSVGFDNNMVAINVADHFGSLDKASLLTHMSKVYTQDEYRVKGTTSNAGIGLATVFRTGASLMFVSESRTKTEATVFFRKTDNYREFKTQFQFLSTQFYF